MFWRKKKSPIYDHPSLIHTLASRLGVERRQNIRVKYPSRAPVCRLPRIAYGGQYLAVRDISVGGCCVVDPQGVLGSAIGNGLELSVDWSTVVEQVQCRVVASVTDHRHVQFLDLKDHRRVLLARSMASGVRAISVRRHAPARVPGPDIQAAEMWSSIHGDSVTIERHEHRLAQIHLQDQLFYIFRDARPLKPDNESSSRYEFEKLILFVSNILSPSPAILKLGRDLEERLLAERP